MKERGSWLGRARASLEKLEVDFAVRVYRQLNDVSLVWSLDEIKDIEDKKLLSGHIAMMLGDYQLAQDLYLQSSQPVEALHMRRDLLQWDQALTLADRLAPGEIPTISREFAQQLEFTGDYPAALMHYERGILVANKTDLVKSRAIKPLEGKQVAIHYNIKYIETSPGSVQYNAVMQKGY